jgi:hypothetical protein
MSGSRRPPIRRYWRLAKYVGVGDTELGAGLVDVQRVRVREGADAALAGMYGSLSDKPSPVRAERPRPASATEVLREQVRRDGPGRRDPPRR